MKKLYQAYKDLPPELRMMIALMGLGTPAGVIYFLSRYLGWTSQKVMIAAAVGIAVIALIGFLINRIAGFAGRQRIRRMSDELESAGEAGPTSMDKANEIKGNNEKFFKAVSEARRIGVSVYDLPWYIVIGDSACGKTTMVNNGDLVLGQGRPEGYLLGTLNYNWWFSEDAVFLDMAGRLVNPQTDGDRREWLAFLQTIRKGRRGFPINGAIVCVPADHLLQDPIEKIEHDANTMLERLRDLQKELGVTFATYFVVTKCDKIPGFMQFFDRASKDVRVKKQMFGWSKPGEYNEPNDPDAFSKAFDAMCERLNGLRLHRLNDDNDVVELGLAYTFPEEFRLFKEPLETYIRMLFPLIKNPKAVKNLLLRGVYFTSATQKGDLIVKHMAERLGQDAARQFEPLEALYPQPSPHFVRDLLFEKVFTEYGLVFRNDAQVRRNRKLARIVQFGAPLTFLMLLTLVILGGGELRKLTGAPTEDVGRARTAAVYDDSQQALDCTAKLMMDAHNLKESTWARFLLSLGWDSDAPARDVNTVACALFEKGPLRFAVKELDAGLKQEKKPLDKETAKAHIEALESYIRWRVQSEQNIPKPKVALKDMFPLKEKIDSLEIVSSRASVANGQSRHVPVWKASTTVARNSAGDLISFRDLWNEYVQSGLSFKSLLDIELPEPFVVGATKDHLAADDKRRSDRREESLEVIKAATENLHKYYKTCAQIDDKHPNPTIQQWMIIRNNCKIVMEQYDRILTLATVAPVNADEYKTKYLAVLSPALLQLKDARKKIERWPTSGVPVKPLQEAIKAEWSEWNKTAKTLLSACPLSASAPAETADRPHIQAIRDAVNNRLLGGAKDSLNGILWKSLVDSGFVAPGAGSIEEFPADKMFTTVDEQFAHLIQVESDDTTKDLVNVRLARAEDANKGSSFLGDVELLLNAAASSGKAAIPSTPEQSRPRINPQEWAKRIYTTLFQLENGYRAPSDFGLPASPKPTNTLDFPEQWSNEDHREFLPDLPDGQSLDLVVKRLDKALQDSKAKNKLLNQEAWNKTGLLKFLKNHARLVLRAKLGSDLEGLGTQLANAKEDPTGWGLATLWPDFQKGRDSHFSMTVESTPRKSITADSSGAKPATATPQTGSKLPTPISRRSEKTIVRPTTPVLSPSGKYSIPECATDLFLQGALESTDYLTRLLRPEGNAYLSSNLYLASESRQPALPSQCCELIWNNEGLAAAYLNRYFQEWKRAYDNQAWSLKWDTCKADTWKEFQARLRAENLRSMSKDLGDPLSEILLRVVYVRERLDPNRLATGDTAEDTYVADCWKNYCTILDDSRRKSWDSELSDINCSRLLQLLSLLDGKSPPQDPRQMVAEHWTTFATAVSEYKSLDLQGFQKDPLPAINWVPAQSETQQVLECLATLKPIKGMAEVKAHAKELLDAAIQDQLVAIQNVATAGEEVSVEGLPYKKDSLDTIDPDKFRSYLIAMASAEKYYENLDKGLAHEDKDKRHAYLWIRQDHYRRCKEWRELLFGDSASGKEWRGVNNSSPPLTVGLNKERLFSNKDNYEWYYCNKPKGSAPVPSGGPQNAYGKLTLELGLVVGSNDNTQPKPNAPGPTQPDLRLALGTQDTLSLKWLFPTNSTAQKITLSGGGDAYRNLPPVTANLGREIDPLSLFAFLQRGGKPTPDRLTWRVGITWLYETTDEKGTTHEEQAGTMLDFTLSQKLPEPVKLLKAPPSASRPER